MRRARRHGGEPPAHRRRPRRRRCLCRRTQTVRSVSLLVIAVPQACESGRGGGSGGLRRRRQIRNRRVARPHRGALLEPPRQSPSPSTSVGPRRASGPKDFTIGTPAVRQASQSARGRVETTHRPPMTSSRRTASPFSSTTHGGGSASRRRRCRCAPGVLRGTRVGNPAVRAAMREYGHLARGAENVIACRRALGVALDDQLAGLDRRLSPPSGAQPLGLVGVEHDRAATLPAPPASTQVRHVTHAGAHALTDPWRHGVGGVAGQEYPATRSGRRTGRGGGSRRSRGFSRSPWKFLDR